jgi:acetyl-CoA C-acetyltransferase
MTFINAGSARIVVSGGMESMTNAPYCWQKREAAIAPDMTDYRSHDDGRPRRRLRGRPLEWAISARPPRKPISSPAKTGRLRHGDADPRPQGVEGGAFKAEIAPIT